jgi:hypothetical protein
VYMQMGCEVGELRNVESSSGFTSTGLVEGSIRWVERKHDSIGDATIVLWAVRSISNWAGPQLRGRDFDPQALPISLGR